MKIFMKSIYMVLTPARSSAKTIFYISETPLNLKKLFVITHWIGKNDATLMKPRGIMDFNECNMISIMESLHMSMCISDSILSFKKYTIDFVMLIILNWSGIIVLMINSKVANKWEK